MSGGGGDNDGVADVKAANHGSSMCFNICKSETMGYRKNKKTYFNRNSDHQQLLFLNKTSPFIFVVTKTDILSRFMMLSSP